MAGAADQTDASRAATCRQSPIGTPKGASPFVVVLRMVWATSVTKIRIRQGLTFVNHATQQYMARPNFRPLRFRECSPTDDDGRTAK